MKKDTGELLEELRRFSDFDRFFSENAGSVEEISLSEYLNALIKEKGLSKAKIIRDAQLSEVYAYQIFSGIRAQPTREKVLCLAFGMGLGFDETQTLLKKTGYPTLYAKNPSDCVIIFALMKGYDVVKTNELLFEYGRETLG